MRLILEVLRYDNLHQHVPGKVPAILVESDDQMLAMLAIVPTLPVMPETQIYHVILGKIYIKPSCCYSVLPNDSAGDKRSPSRLYSIGRSNMTPKVARWATQLSISGNMIKQKTTKFFVNNLKKNSFLLKMSQNNLDNQETIWATQFSTMCGPVAVGDPWIWAIHSSDSTANHPSCHPGWVKLSVGWVKFYIIILKFCVLPVQIFTNRAIGQVTWKVKVEHCLLQGSFCVSVCTHHIRERFHRTKNAQNEVQHVQLRTGIKGKHTQTCVCVSCNLSVVGNAM